MIDFITASGMTSEEYDVARDLVKVWRSNWSRNSKRMAHYKGKTRLKDLGISIPPPLKKMLSKTSVMWSAKAVDLLANCSTFDGFSYVGDYENAELDKVLDENQFGMMYDQAKMPELIHGSVLWTVTAGEYGEPDVVITASDFMHSSAIWDFRHKQIYAGMTVVDVNPKKKYKPTAVNIYTADSVLELRLGIGGWVCERKQHSMGRPLIEPMRFAPLLDKPFGQSRITPAIMELEDEANREAVRMIMNAELYTAPTRWIMGAEDGIFEGDRWEAYVGGYFALTKDEDGDTPSTGSYPVGGMNEHVAYMRNLAGRFASETSIPISSLLHTDANPQSADAIRATENELVKKAQDFNRMNGVALRNVGLMAVAILDGVPFANVSPEVKTMKVKWKDPAHPSLPSQVDAMIKLASAEPGITKSRVFWEQSCFDETTVDRIMSDLRRNSGDSAINAILNATRSSESRSEAQSDQANESI